MSSPTSRLQCAHHDGAPAIAICAECGADICGACHGADPRGFAVCPPCRGSAPETGPEWERADRAYGPPTYARTLWQVLRHPRSFFTGVPLEGASIPAAVFGYVSLLVGLLADRIWKFALTPSFEATLSEYAATRSIPTDDLEWLLFLSVPISAAIVGGIHVATLKFAADFAGAELGWNGAVRLGGYALGTFTLLLVPPVYGFHLGTLLAVFWLFNHEASALQHHFEFTPWRATLTAAAPVLLTLTCAGVG